MDGVAHVPECIEDGAWITGVCTMSYLLHGPWNLFPMVLGVS